MYCNGTVRTVGTEFARFIWILFLQYEFVYRAIADYVDLYMNKEEEYEYSVPVGTLNNGTTKVRL